MKGHHEASGDIFSQIFKQIHINQLDITVVYMLLLTKEKCATMKSFFFKKYSR
jgi:hypothetical protein